MDKMERSLRNSYYFMIKDQQDIELKFSKARAHLQLTLSQALLQAVTKWSDSVLAIFENPRDETWLDEQKNAIERDLEKDKNLEFYRIGFAWAEENHLNEPGTTFEMFVRNMERNKNEKSEKRDQP